MLHVIEGDDAVIDDQVGGVEADFIAQEFRKAFDEPHDVVRKIADGSGDKGGETRHADGMKALDAFAQKRYGIALLPDEAIGTFHHAGARDVAKNFLRGSHPGGGFSLRRGRLRDRRARTTRLRARPWQMRTARRAQSATHDGGAWTPTPRAA